MMLPTEFAPTVRKNSGILAVCSTTVAGGTAILARLERGGLLSFQRVVQLEF
jgi:hypothetical protein